MATLEEAIAAGALDRLATPDWEVRNAIRPFYATPDFVSWADNTPGLHDPALAVGGRLLFEHLLQMVCDFQCDRYLHAGDIRRMLPTRHGIWHLYPPGLRVYGWCPMPHAFVAVTGALERDTKATRGLNDAKRNEVRRFIATNQLEQTIVRGDFLAVFPH
jgi:hypothetical protein